VFPSAPGPEAGKNPGRLEINPPQAERRPPGRAELAWDSAHHAGHLAFGPAAGPADRQGPDRSSSASIRPRFQPLPAWKPGETSRDSIPIEPCDHLARAATLPHLVDDSPDAGEVAIRTNGAACSSRQHGHEKNREPRRRDAGRASREPSANDGNRRPSVSSLTYQWARPSSVATATHAGHHPDTERRDGSTRLAVSTIDNQVSLQAKWPPSVHPNGEPTLTHRSPLFATLPGETIQRLDQSTHRKKSGSKESPDRSGSKPAPDPGVFFSEAAPSADLRHPHSLQRTYFIPDHGLDFK
jgi:hypothetical protein